MKAKSVHAIEISAGSVKIASFRIQKKKPPVLTFLFAEAYDSKPKMEEVLRRGASAVAEKNAVYATSVWAATMMTRKVVMRLDDSEDIHQTLNLEAEKFVPFPINECLVDGYMIRELENGNQADVMFIASKKDLIIERCELLKRSGIRLGYMDVHPVALANLYARLESQYTAEPFALVHLGDVPGLVKGEENFASVCFEGKPAVIRDLGGKLSEPEVGDAQWRYVVTQVANAVSFFENSMKLKVASFRVTGELKTCEEFIKRYKEHAGSDFSRWSALQSLQYADQSLAEKASSQEAAVTVLAGILARRLFE